MAKIHCDDIVGHRKWGVWPYLDYQKYLQSSPLLTECQNAGTGRPPGCGKASTLWHTQGKLRLEIRNLCTRTHCQEHLHCAQFSQHTATSEHTVAQTCALQHALLNLMEESLPRPQKGHMTSETVLQASFPAQGSADPTGYVVLRFRPA